MRTPSPQGVVVDVHENVLRQVPFEPSPAGPAPEGSGPAPENPGPAPEGPGPAPENPGPAPNGPVYDGPAQVLGPGFAPFKPYLRPHFFHLRVSINHIYTCTCTCMYMYIHVHVHLYIIIHFHCTSLLYMYVMRMHACMF